MTTIYVVIGLLMILGVIAQPVFGLHAIPEFFDYTMSSALMVGAIDACLLFGGFFLISKGF